MFTATHSVARDFIVSPPPSSYMPSSASRHTIARQWELLQRLPSAGAGVTAAELCADLGVRGFSVSKRQVERDLRDLAEIFPLERNDTSTPFGWRWASGAHIGFPGMDVAQALSLKLVQATVRPLLPASLLQGIDQSFAQADRKLADLARTNALCRWQDKVRHLPAQLTLLAPNIDPVVVQAVHEALLADEQLDIGYRSMEAQAASALRLHPLALIQRGPLSFLAATAWEYADVRIYALHRMSHAQRTHEPTIPPQDFQVDAWLASGAAQFGGQKSIQLRAKVSSALERILTEALLAPGQRIRNGQLHVALFDSWELRWWILSQGDSIEVLHPKSLRRDIAAALSNAAAQYANT